MFKKKLPKKTNKSLKLSKTKKSISFLRKDKLKKEKKDRFYLKIFFLKIKNFGFFILNNLKSFKKFYQIHNIFIRWSFLSLIVVAALTGIVILFSPISNSFFLNPLKSHFNEYFNSSGKMYIKYINKDPSDPISQDDVAKSIKSSISTLFTIYAHTFKDYSENDVSIETSGSFSESIHGKYVNQYLVSISGPLDLIHLLEQYHNFLSGTQTITITDQWGNGIGYDPVEKKIFPTDPSPFSDLYVKNDTASNHHLGWPSLSNFSLSQVSSPAANAIGNNNLNNYLQTVFSSSDTDIFKTIINQIYQNSRLPISKNNPWGYFYKDWINDWNTPSKNSLIPPYDDAKYGHHNFLMFWLGDPWNNDIWDQKSVNKSIVNDSDPYKKQYTPWSQRQPKVSSKFLSYDLIRKLFPLNNQKSSPLISLSDLTHLHNDFLKNNTEWKSIDYLYSPLIFGTPSNNSSYYYKSPFYNENNYFTPSSIFSINGTINKSLTQSDWITSESNRSSSNLSFGFLGAYDISSSLPLFNQNIAENSFTKTNDKGKTKLLTDPKNFTWSKWPDKSTKSTEYLSNYKNPYTIDNFDIKQVSFNNDIDSLKQYPNILNSFTTLAHDPTTGAATDTYKNKWNQILEIATQGYVTNIYALYDQNPSIMPLDKLWIIGAEILLFLILIFVFFFYRFGLMAIPLILSFIFFNTLFLIFLVLMSPYLQPFILIIYLVSLVIFLIFGLKNMEKIYGMIKSILSSPTHKIDKSSWSKYHKSYYIDILSLLMSFVVVYLGYNFFYNLFQGIIIVWLFSWFISTILIFFFCKFIFSTFILTVHKNPAKFTYLKFKIEKQIKKLNLKSKLKEENQRLLLILKNKNLTFKDRLRKVMNLKPKNKKNSKKNKK